MPLREPPVSRQRLDLSHARAVAELQQELKAALPILEVPLLSGRLVEDVDVSSGGLVKVKHGLGRDYRGFLVVAGTPVAEDSSNNTPGTEIWLRAADSWESIGRKTVSGSTATTIDFTGLNGLSEHNYKLEYELFMNQGSNRRLRILLNGSTNNLHAFAAGWTQAATFQTTAQTQIFCGLSLTTGGVWRNRGEARFAVGLPSATRRSVSTATDCVATTTAEYRWEQVLAQWQTTSGDLTGISIQSTASGSASALIEPGSWAELFRARIPDKTSIWVF